MFSRVLLILFGMFVSMMFSACGKADSLQDNDQRVEIRLSEVGETTVPKYWGRFYNYDVQLTNHLPHSIFLLRMENPKSISDYLKERNPEAWCYYVERAAADKTWSDARFGLSVIYGKGDVAVELKSKQSITFRIPVRLDDDAFKRADKIRVAVKASEKKGKPPETKVYSNDLPFPPK